MVQILGSLKTVSRIAGFVWVLPWGEGVVLMHFNIGSMLGKNQKQYLNMLINKTSQ